MSVWQIVLMAAMFINVLHHSFLHLRHRDELKILRGRIKQLEGSVARLYEHGNDDE